MKKLIAIVLGITFLFSTANLLAQGVLLDRNYYDKLPQQSSYGDGGKSESKALEGIYKIDLKPYCPAVINQGTIASCTGWSVGYAAQSIQYAKQQNWENQQERITNHAFSAHFIYNQLRKGQEGGCNIGTHIGEAMQLLVDKGNQLSQKYDKNRNCLRQPTDQELTAAANFKIKDYTTLFSSREKNSKLKTNKIKLSLAQGKPVVIAMPIYQSFIQLRTATYRGKRSTEERLDYHAMTVIGFDETRGAFEIMNSWGSSWANKGFVWINYETFAEFCVFAFQMDIHSEATHPTTQNSQRPSAKELIQTELIFIKPTTRPNSNVMVFEHFPLEEGTDGIYHLKDTFHQFDRGQLIIKNTTANTYLYLYSIDPEGAINVHWPRDQQVNSKFGGLNESPLITVPEVELILPEPTIAFQFNKVGEEQFHLLLSKKPLLTFTPQTTTHKPKDIKKLLIKITIAP